MSENMERRYLKWYNKIGYGSGDVAGNVVYAFLSSFVMIYLTDTVGLNPGIVGTLIAVSKLFDGITDIFFGSMIDKTHSKLGKARPWMLYGYIGCAITLVGIFAIPMGMSEFAKYAWFFICYSLLNAVFYTANNIAYSALTSLVTKNSAERVEMGSYRFMFAFATSLAIQSYITYDNVLVWKALKDLAQLAPQYAHLEKTASEIKDAIMTHCVQKDAAGKPYFGWSIDLNGSHDVYDEPPGSLQLLPFFDFCSPNDEIYRNTVAMIRSPEYKYSFANSPINEIGCPHAPHPWILSLANSLLCGRVEHCRAILEKISMDNGIACESVDGVTGYCTTGEAFATCAGFLCHSIREALL